MYHGSRAGIPATVHRSELQRLIGRELPSLMKYVD
jgi:hypothetical protein